MMEKEIYAFERTVSHRHNVDIYEKLEKVSKEDDIKEILIETLPKFITEEKTENEPICDTFILKKIVVIKYDYEKSSKNFYEIHFYGILYYDFNSKSGSNCYKNYYKLGDDSITSEKIVIINI